MCIYLSIYIYMCVYSICTLSIYISNAPVIFHCNIERSIASKTALVQKLALSPNQTKTLIRAGFWHIGLGKLESDHCSCMLEVSRLFIYKHLGTMTQLARSLKIVTVIFVPHCNILTLVVLCWVQISLLQLTSEWTWELHAMGNPKFSQLLDELTQCTSTTKTRSCASL